MMRDAFGDALQKIASAAHKPSSPAEISSATDFPATASQAESSSITPHLITPPVITIIKEPRAFDSTSHVASASHVNSTVREIPAPTIELATVEHPAEATSAGSLDSLDTPALLPHPADENPADESRSPLTFLLNHRRQTAAVVVLICIAAIWSDDGSSQTLFTSSDVKTSESQSAAETDPDSMLSDFDAVQVRPLREPADPVEPAPADPFPFSIPADEAEASVNSEPPSSNLSRATNQTPQAPSPATARDSASEQSPFSPVSSSASHSVRFTGQIQPLK